MKNKWNQSWESGGEEMGSARGTVERDDDLSEEIVLLEAVVVEQLQVDQCAPEQPARHVEEHECLVPLGSERRVHDARLAEVRGVAAREERGLAERVRLAGDVGGDYLARAADVTRDRLVRIVVAELHFDLAEVRVPQRRRALLVVQCVQFLHSRRKRETSSEISWCFQRTV